MAKTPKTPAAGQSENSRFQVREDEVVFLEAGQSFTPVDPYVVRDSRKS